MTAIGVVVEGNRSTSGLDSGTDGGGVKNNGTLSITNSVIRDNVGGFDRSGIVGGGGISNTGDLTLTASLITTNRSPSGQGGGISSVGTALIVDSEITANTVPLDGAASRIPA